MKKVIPHTEAHDSGDYIREGELDPARVQVRLTRIRRLNPKSPLTWFEVEISILDEDYTFRDAVTKVLSEQGFKVLSDGSRYQPATVGAPYGWRAPKGYVFAGDISA